MSPLTPWRIEKQTTSVPGRFAPFTFREWYVVLNPHGGRQAFMLTHEAAEEAMRQAKAQWVCYCQECQAERRTA